MAEGTTKKISWFKFYLNWVEVIKELPDDERLQLYDFICESANKLIEGNEVVLSDAKIPPTFKGWLKTILPIMKANIDQATKEQKSKSEGGKKAMRNRWNNPESEQETESSLLEYNSEIAQKELKELRGLFARNPQMIKAFCENVRITCVNAYFALCYVFVRNYMGTGNKPHKNADDTYKHFTGWFVKTCEQDHTRYKIERDANKELQLWNRDFPEGSEPFATCDLKKVVNAYLELTNIS